MPEGTRPSAVLESQRLTGLKKRQQIELAGRAVFMWVAIAAVAVSFCIATGQYLFVKWDHNNKVIHAKSEALSTLSTNIENAKQLKQEVDELIANQELANVKTTPTDPNTKSVLGALPAALDPAALAASLQQAILSRSGVAVDSIVVPPELSEEEGTPTETTTVADSTPQEINFSFTVSGSYDKIRTLMNDIQRSIRPIAITSINISGDDADLRVICEAKTYYQPAKTVNLKKETIR